MMSVLMAVVAWAQGSSALDQLKADPRRAYGMDYPYTFTNQQQTKAPKGYVPFYFTHYGRHGSRWLIAEDSYERVLNPLRKANQQGKLTPVGQKTLQQLEEFNKTTHLRLGDLTTVGERQHHGIGR